LTAKQLTNGALPAGLDNGAWLAVPGFYPQLTAFAGTDAAKLSAAAVIFSDKDTINRVRSGFGLSSGEQVVWTADPDVIAIGNDTSSPDVLSGSVQKEGSVAIAVTANGSARQLTLNTPALKYAEAAATPTADPGIYVFMGDVSVTLATDEPNASIYYTLDDSDPDPWSSLYTGPIQLTDTTTIRAIAVADDKEFSEPFTGTWMKRPPTYGGVGAFAVPDPGIVAQVGANKMQTNGQSAVPIAKNSELTLSAPAGQTIYYTTDGSAPTKDSPQYKGSIMITGDMTVKMITDQNDKVVTINYQVENAKYELKSDAGKTKYISGYPNHEFRPDSPLSRYEAVDVLEPLLDLEDVTVGNTFDDVGSGQANSVALLTSAGIFDGYPDHTFGGDKGLTRAEFVVIMARVLKLPIADAGESEFADVQDHWSAQYIDAFAQAGYVEGFPDGTFKPDEEITRAEAVVLINRVIGGGQSQEGNEASFTDLPPSHWAYQDIMSAAK
jgi:hypothetical protein